MKNAPALWLSPSHRGCTKTPLGVMSGRQIQAIRDGFSRRNQRHTRFFASLPRVAFRGRLRPPFVVCLPVNVNSLELPAEGSLGA